MHILWITRQDPRLADAGDLIHSLGLLRALAATGETEITVLAHRGKPDESVMPGITWELPADIPGKSPLSLLSRLPSDAHRLGNPALRRTLASLLARPTFDWVAIDQAASGWALDLLPADTRILYVAHNHEAALRAEVAGEHDGPLPLRLALRRDAAKYAALERRICARAQVIAAITPRDKTNFRREFPDKTHLVLSPGYEGLIPTGDPPEITAATPRRVVLAGTFEWIAKKRNLTAFLKSAANHFPQAGIEFHVVGKAAPETFSALADRFPWATFAANVPSMEPHLKDARIGLIPESLGGGFKLKALDYIFRGLPLASIEPALSGLPLEPGTDAIAAGSTDELAAAVATRIDELDFLNHAARSALEKCRHAFDWRDRGESLARALHQA